MKIKKIISAIMTIVMVVTTIMVTSVTATAAKQTADKVETYAEWYAANSNDEVFVIDNGGNYAHIDNGRISYQRITLKSDRGTILAKVETLDSMLNISNGQSLQIWVINSDVYTDVSTAFGIMGFNGFSRDGVIIFSKDTYNYAPPTKSPVVSSTQVPSRPQTDKEWSRDFYSLFEIKVATLEKNNSNNYAKVATTAKHHLGYQSLQVGKEDTLVEWKKAANAGAITVGSFETFIDTDGRIVVNHYGDEYKVNVKKGDIYTVIGSNNLGGGNGAVSAIWEAAYEAALQNNKVVSFHATVIGHKKSVFEMTGNVV